MLRSQVVVALRALFKNKLLTLINLLGLAIGLACFLFSVLYVQFESNFDTFHKDGDRIFRVYVTAPMEGVTGGMKAPTSGMFAPSIAAEIPGVETAVRIYSDASTTDAWLKVGDKSFRQNGLYADRHFFDLFSFPLVLGSAAEALAIPKTIVISSQLAEKMFARTDPVGQTVSIGNMGDFRVTGVLGDMPRNSHLRFDFLLSFQTLAADPAGLNQIENWGFKAYITYCKLRPGYDATTAETAFSDLITRHTAETGGSSQRLYSAHLEPIRNIHLRSQMKVRDTCITDVKYIYIALSIGLVILVLGCLNYMNLTAARSLGRFREMGIKTVLGAQRRHIIGQYIIEALIVSLFALFGAVVIIDSMLPVVGDMIGIPDRLADLWQWRTTLYLGVAVILMSVLAGGVPALSVSSMRPFRVLHGAGFDGPRHAWVRNALIVFQFAIVVVALVAAIVMKSQLDYVKSADIGYNRERLVVITLRDTLAVQQSAIIKQKILEHEGIIGATLGDREPHKIFQGCGLNVTTAAGESEFLISYFTNVDYDYIDLLSMEMVEGRAFSREDGDAPGNAVIINQTLAQLLNWDDPIGKILPLHFARDARIIGIVRDFNYQSLHYKIEPLMLLPAEEGNYLMVRVSGDNLSETIAFLGETVGEFSPNFPFEYYFLDDSFNMLYREDRSLGSVAVYSSGLAIFIACLGLFGLASFLTRRRKREIAVRKVLGATVPAILKILCGRFMVPVAAANAIGWPLAYYLMHLWLENFAYRVRPGIGVFVAAGLLSAIVAFAAVSGEAVRAARTDPARVLHYE